MKIISLNCLGGIVFKPLLAFIKKHGTDTDVFCFQEMHSSEDPNIKNLKDGWRLNLLQEIQKILPDFKTHFAPTQDDYEVEPNYPGQSQLGTAIFYKKNLSITDKGDFFIYNKRNNYVLGDWSTLGHNAVYIKIKTDDGPVVVCTLHGNSQPANKLDSPLRIKQSKTVLDFLKTEKAEKIVIGDFNLFPETKSIKMFEEAGFRNLVVEYGIKTTRGSHMRKLFPEYEHGEYGFQEFADYAFVTPDIVVNSFEVPDVPISDHLPLILEVE